MLAVGAACCAQAASARKFLTARLLKGGLVADAGLAGGAARIAELVEGAVLVVKVEAVDVVVLRARPPGVTQAPFMHNTFSWGEVWQR